MPLSTEVPKVTPTPKRMPVLTQAMSTSQPCFFAMACRISISRPAGSLLWAVRENGQNHASAQAMIRPMPFTRVIAAHVLSSSGIAVGGKLR